MCMQELIDASTNIHSCIPTADRSAVQPDEEVFDQHHWSNAAVAGFNSPEMCFLSASGPLLSTCHCSG